MPPETEPSEQQPFKWSSADRDSFKLWAIVSVLWTGATLFRVIRVWVPVDGWRSVIAGPWLWLEITLPPVIFAIVLLAIRVMIQSRRNC